MLDIGWQELLVIGVLTLIVVPTRELPSMMRSIGQWVGRIRGMARDFQRTMNDAAREADVSNFKEIRDLKKINPLDDFKEQAAKAQSFLNNPTSAVTELESAPKTDAKADDKDAAGTVGVEEDDPGMVATDNAPPVKPAAKDPAPAKAETPAATEDTPKAASS